MQACSEPHHEHLARVDRVEAKLQLIDSQCAKALLHLLAELNHCEARILIDTMAERQLALADWWESNSPYQQLYVLLSHPVVKQLDLTPVGKFAHLDALFVKDERLQPLKSSYVLTKSALSCRTILKSATTFLSTLKDSKLTVINLSGVTLSGIDFQYQNFRYANFAQSTFHRCHLAHACFDHASLNQVAFKKCSALTNVSFQHASLQAFALEDTTAVDFLTQNDFTYADLSNNTFNDLDFTGHTLTWHGARLNHCSLVRCNFTEQNLNQVSFASSNCDYACFTGANLTLTSFNGARLIFAHFQNSMMIHVDLQYATLPEQAIYFKDAHIVDCQLRGATIPNFFYRSEPLQCQLLNNTTLLALTQILQELFALEIKLTPTVHNRFAETLLKFLREGDAPLTITEQTDALYTQFLKQSQSGFFSWTPAVVVAYEQMKETGALWVRR